MSLQLKSPLVGFDNDMVSTHPRSPDSSTASTCEHPFPHDHYDEQEDDQLQLTLSATQLPLVSAEELLRHPPLEHRRSSAWDNQQWAKRNASLLNRAFSSHYKNIPRGEEYEAIISSFLPIECSTQFNETPQAMTSQTALSPSRHSLSTQSIAQFDESQADGLVSPSVANRSGLSVSRTSIVGRGAHARVDIRCGTDGEYYAEKTMLLTSCEKFMAARREVNFACRYVSRINGDSSAKDWSDCYSPTAAEPMSPTYMVSRIIDSCLTHSSDAHLRSSCEEECPPGIVKILAAFTEPSEHTTHIIMEYMDGGDAATAIAGPATDIRVIAAVARQMLEGLRFIHGSMRALHRDIKPENVLVSTTGRVALSDFGCSAVTTHDDDAVQFSDQVGTILYMSPERLLGDVHGVECDVWSLGVTIAALATGKHPFVDARVVSASSDRMWALAEVLHYTSDIVEEYRAATEAAVAKALLPRDNADLTDFVHCCTWRRSDIASLLEHPFVRGMSLDDAVEHVRKHVTPDA